MLRQQTGVKFIFKKNWKALFQKDTWFEWTRPWNQDIRALKRFTIWNVGAWFFYRFILKLITQCFVPIIRTAERYWYDWEEGSMYKLIPREIWEHGMEVKFFRLGKEK